MIVHLVDGTYELFRHFYGIRRFKQSDPPFGAVSGVLHTVAEMLEGGATHIGVATDHIIESFRNDLWSEYKTGDGIEPALHAQFFPLEEALAAMGVAVWPMIELEADDALASAAHIAAQDERVQKVCIGRVARSAMRRVSVPSSALSRLGSPTTWRSWVMRQMVIQESRAVDLKPPPDSSIVTADLKISLLKSSMTTTRGRCSSRS
jgi:5'-3' exonuclease-like protein